jgi:tripartite-type tricarboxylate transporter receptor subunit TctC
MRRLLEPLLVVAALGLNLGLCNPAHAAGLPSNDYNWPTRPLRLVVPFAAGDSIDLLARSVAQGLEGRTKQPVTIINRPGAETVAGTDAVVKAGADGYTVLLSDATSFTINPALRDRLPHDPSRDLVPVAIVARTAYVLVVDARSPWSRLPDLIEAARSQAGSVRVATFGTGSEPHLAAALLERAADIRLPGNVVTGSAAAITAVVNGEVQVAIDTVSAVAPQVRAGTLRALAVLGAERSASLPDVPTVVELDLPEARFDMWYAFAVRSRVPAWIQERLTHEVAAVLADPAVQAQLRAQALEPAWIPAAPARRLISEEISKYRALKYRAHIVME